MTTPGSVTEWLLKRLMRRRGWGPKDIGIAYVGSGLAKEIALKALDDTFVTMTLLDHPPVMAILDTTAFLPRK